MNEWVEKMPEYFKFCAYQKKLDEKTLKSYKTDLRQFKAFFPENTDVIVKSHIADYLASLNKNYKPKSVKRKIASLKAYFKYLEYEEYIHQNPFAKLRIKFKEPFILPQTIPLSNIREIFSAIYEKKKICQADSRRYGSLLRDIAVLELLFATGIRVSELCGLLYKNANLVEGFIRIFGKGAKERIIQINNLEVLGALKEYQKYFYDHIHKTGFFFVNRLGRGLSAQSIRLMIKKYAKETDIPIHITPHMFRHSFATLLMEEDVDIRYIQCLLGHSSITTTQIYTHVTTEKQRLILAAKHPRNKLFLGEKSLFHCFGEK